MGAFVRVILSGGVVFGLVCAGFDSDTSDTSVIGDGEVEVRFPGEESL